MKWWPDDRSDVYKRQISYLMSCAWPWAKCVTSRLDGRWRIWAISIAASSSGLIMSARPVSYTHLDVYKRQQYGIRIVRISTSLADVYWHYTELKQRRDDIIIDSWAPVSYTHQRCIRDSSTYHSINSIAGGILIHVQLSTVITSSITCRSCTNWWFEWV